MKFFIFTLVVCSEALDSITDSYCSEDVVRAAKSAGVVAYLYNCLKDPYSVGAQICLQNFLKQNPALGIEGNCRQAYQTMANTWLLAGLAADTIHCVTYPLPADDLPPSDCIQNTLATGMDTFHDSVGFYPSFPTCSAAQVRKYTRKFYEFLATSHIRRPEGLISQFDGVPCDACYNHAFITTLSDNAVTSDYAESWLDAECLNANGPTEACIDTTMMITARQVFAQCSGYDALFVGPNCSSNQVALVGAVVPKPYYAFAHCAYNPRASFCVTIDSYVEYIESITSADCVACYTELSSDFATLALADTTGICATDVLSDACSTYMAPALVNFASCSGSTLDIAE